VQTEIVPCMTTTNRYYFPVVIVPTLVLCPTPSTIESAASDTSNTKDMLSSKTGGAFHIQLP